jgi:DNA mismatch repair protein MutS
MPELKSTQLPLDESSDGFNTPMMKQYMEVKNQYQDCLLFFRMGDFYELFLEDAKIGARVLDITLTGRSRGKDGKIPMAGVPYHAVDSYLNKLVKAGYKVAICEQLTPPNKNGLVERDVIRIVTPGTVMDEKALDSKKNNYIMSLFVEKDRIGLAFADISTGLFQVSEVEAGSGRQSVAQILADELSRFMPSECILSDTHYNDPEILKGLKVQSDMNIFPYSEFESYADRANLTLTKHFKVRSLDVFDLHNKPLATKVAAGLLGYLQNTQKGQVEHIRSVRLYGEDDAMQLDRSTIVNLELFSTLREGEKRGSLLSVIDETVTARGGRLRRRWLTKPLLRKEPIVKRHEMVEELINQRQLRIETQEIMGEIVDIERIVARLSVDLGNPKDLANLKGSLRLIEEVGKRVALLSSTLAGELKNGISDRVGKIADLIEKYILKDPAFDPKNGNLVNDSVNPELDRLRDIVRGGKNWITDLEQQERQRTGISSLKVRFNKVFGFYIEVSNSNLDSVPKDYMRKQTLVNGERFITPELKKQEEIILQAEERMCEMEYEIFLEVVKQVLEETEAIQQAAHVIATVDCLMGFAKKAESSNYCRPEILENDGVDTGRGRRKNDVERGSLNVVKSYKLDVKGGRHPVVEQLLETSVEGRFVPNDTLLYPDGRQLLLITGPNMAGKSVYIRQVAVIVLMAQIGCFVPADSAVLSLVDRIFVRSGASDVITQGLSTFMVEMVETAQILNNATSNSLIIMDEIGRGTSTYDGISIAWAVAEFLITAPEISAKTLFATHYHELQELEECFPSKVVNLHMAVEEEAGRPVFLHTIAEGGASHSFGIAVAKLAGVPEQVTKRADELLKEIEERNREDVVKSQPTSPDTSQANSIVNELSSLNIATTTPLQALQYIAEWQSKVKK